MLTIVDRGQFALIEVLLADGAEGALDCAFAKEVGHGGFVGF